MNIDEPEDGGLFPAFSDAMLADAADAAASHLRLQFLFLPPSGLICRSGTNGNQDLQSSEPNHGGGVPFWRLASTVSMSNLLQRVVLEP